MAGYKSPARAERYGGYWVYPGDTKAREYFPSRTEAIERVRELNALKRKHPNAFPEGKVKIQKVR